MLALGLKEIGLAANERTTMHTLEPYYRWQKYYEAAEDERSPFFGREYDLMYYTNNIYGYFIHPQWDYIGSETLYVKLLYVNYEQEGAIIELIGEWNDALNNDIMWFKRNLLDPLIQEGVRKFILIGENVMNFHGSDDCYYEEWFEDVEDGWIAGINFRDFVLEEWKNYNLDWYINYGGELDAMGWRTLKPQILLSKIDQMVMRRLGV